MNAESLGAPGPVTPTIRPRWTALVGIFGLYFLGWALALLGAIATIYLLAESGAGMVGGFLLFSVFTAVPAVVLWRTRGRYLRSLAAGLASPWVLALCLVVWHPWSTMSSQEVERAIAEIRESGVPAFYLGDAAGGFEWNDYYLDNSQANFFYGKCRASDPEWGCTDRDIDVFNEPTDVTLAGDFIAGCKRRSPIQGAAAVTLGGYYSDGPEDNIGLFTGSTLVVIRFADDRMGLAQKVALAATIRPIGAPRATTLPPPTESVRAYVDRYCSATP